MPKIDIVNAKNIIESNPEKAFFKLKNTGGPKGDTGAQGPQGPKGDTGAQGAPGASASVTVGSTTTLSAGADATVTNSGDTRNAILNFGIPTGAQGPQGIQGPKGDTGPMGQTGAKGDTGAAATVQVGNTNTGAPGTNAQVTNAGNEHFAVFNFTIPRGDKGETGSTGPQGPKGDTGEQGPQGIQGPKGDTGSVKSDVVAELPETGEEDTFYLVNREATEQTATGKAINFTNNDNAGDITDFQLDGETSQNGTPTPSAPVAVNTTTGENVVKICGKNILNTDNTVGEQTQAGITASMSGSVISIDGEGTGADGSTSGMNRTWALTTQIPLAAGTYSISGTLLSGSWTAAAQSRLRSIRMNLSSGTYKEVSASNGSTALAGNTFTLTEATNVVSVQIMVYGQVKFYDAEFGLQLEKGSTATAYEPYQGQSYEVNLGKNLFDESAATLNYRIGSDGNPYGDNNSFLSDYIQVLPSTVYSYSRSGAGYGSSAIAYYDSSKTFISRTMPIITITASSGTMTTPSNAAYVRITDYKSLISTIQFEISSTPTSYAAYFEPIELCKIGDYQDYIYKSGDKWYVRKEVGKAELWNGTNWRRLNTGTTGEYRFSVKVSNTDIPTSSSSSTLVDMYSNCWLACTRLQTYTQTQGIATTTSTDIGVESFIAFVDSLKTSDVDGWKAWLTANMSVVYYPSTTPTDTEITNQALIAQLDNVASAPLYTGVNNITTITPNEQGTLEIKYVTYDKYNQNKVYIWNDTLQQWQIIVP